jgi:hypothetical protein
MVIVNTLSGATYTFDLRDSQSLEDLLYLIRSNLVTALSIINDGVQQVLPVPKRFSTKPVFGVELVANGSNSPIAERVYAQVSDIRVSLTRTFSSKLVRVDLVRTGKRLCGPYRSNGDRHVKP